MLDSEYYDELEIRDPDEREILLFEALGRHLRATKEDSPYFEETFKDIGPEDVKSRADLVKLPITCKSDLSALQKKDPPLAGMTNIAPSNFIRLYQSPGPTYEGEASLVDRLTPNELVKRGVIQVMEGRHCFEHLTVEENLLIGAYTRTDGRANVAADLEKVYHYFPRLKERRTAQAGYTSGGEQQMTAIGRALMGDNAPPREPQAKPLSTPGSRGRR